MVTVPTWWLRRVASDPGIGKFTDIVRVYRNQLMKDGANVYSSHAPLCYARQCLCSCKYVCGE